MTSGCCAVAGFGMKNAQIQRKETSDRLHESIVKVFDRVAK